MRQETQVTKGNGTTEELRLHRSATEKLERQYGATERLASCYRVTEGLWCYQGIGAGLRQSRPESRSYQGLRITSLPFTALCLEMAR
jgi:hypothetical protein